MSYRKSIHVRHWQKQLLLRIAALDAEPAEGHASHKSAAPTLRHVPSHVELEPEKKVAKAGGGRAAGGKCELCGEEGSLCSG